jgi:DsbC/DsbD-like thiol-disulfide interchange protein
MITRSDRLRRTAAPRAIGLCVASLAAASNAIAADDASRWDGDVRSAVRLVAASSPPDGNAPLRAGIEVRLKPGWHTYWRYPGDAGVPPRFDFAGSQNVKAVAVRWPAPQPIPEEGLTAIGYTGDVLLPLAIVPQDRAKPVTLRLKLDYAVCEKLCVPAEAEARVPKKVALGEGSPLAIKSVRREDGPSRPRVVVDVAAPGATDLALFAEGPTPDWALPVPTAVAGAPTGMQRFAFELDGAPAGARYEGAAVTLTARAGNAAIEVLIRLD